MNGWYALLAIVVALGYIIGNLLLLRDSARYVERFTKRTGQNTEASNKSDRQSKQ